MRPLFVTLGAALLSAACGGGDVASPLPSAPVELACAADASVATPLGRMHNNTWNASAVGAGTGRQCVVQRSVAGATQYGWRWDWPSGSEEVLAYPSIVRGAKPWEAGPGNDARFPRALNGIRRLVLDFDLETTATGRYNLAASLWLINTPTVADPPDETAISGELMVWTQALGGDWNEGQVPLAQATIGGADWLVWSRPSWGDVSGSTSHRWPLVVYTALNPSSQASLDLRAFLVDAVARGLLNGDDTIADVELGHEVVAGTGTSWLRRFNLTLETTD